jgi:predicted extracellular nuclease
MIEEIQITITSNESGVHVNCSIGNPLEMLGMLEIAKTNVLKFIDSQSTKEKAKRKKKVDSTKTWEEKK